MTKQAKKAKTVIAEVETEIRSANKGEWVLGVNGLEQCPGYDHNRYRGYVVRRFLSTEEINFSLEYPDTNGNGIPDAFENRRPISEILQYDPDAIENRFRAFAEHVERERRG